MDVRAYNHLVLGPVYGDNFEKFHHPTDADLVGFDTEFTDLDHWSPDWRLRLVQFYDRNYSYLYDPTQPEQADKIVEILETVPRLVSHDVADCLSVWRAFGMDVTDKNCDTKVMAQLLWPGKTVPHDLKTLTFKHVGPELQALESALHAEFRKMLGKHPEYKLTEKQIGECFATIPLDNPAFRAYAGGDAVGAKQLFCRLEPMLYTMGVDRAWEKECKIRAIATRMAMRGVCVDSPTVLDLHAQWGGRLQVARETWENTYGCVAGSPRRAAVLLESEVKLTKRTKPSKRFPNGNWQLTQKVLEELAEEYPENEPLKLLIEVSETTNTASFMKNILERTDPDGRVHSSISTLGAETGRWSVTDPAIQTAKDFVRRAFVPSPGRVIASFDLGQIEPRIAVGSAEERNLIPDLLAGYDVYSAASAVAFGPDYTPAQRKKMKRVILGTLYAAGVPTLVRQAKYQDGWTDVTPATITEVRNLWKQTAPSIEAFSRELQLLPRVDLESGRYVPQDQARLYRAINSWCQGTARDVLMERLIKISERYDKYLIMTMHDEILMDVPIGELRQVVKFVKAVMESGYNGIPTPTDIEIFPDHWAGTGVPVEEYLNGQH